MLPSHIANYKQVPLPAFAGVPASVPEHITEAYNCERMAPLVIGAISQRSFNRSFLHRVHGFQVWPSTVKAVRCPEFETKPPTSSKRGAVDAFSDRSRRRLRFTAINASPALTTQFVLTYPAQFPTDGKESKSQLNAFLTRFRAKFKGVNYLWVLEFQRRGAPHYHIFSTITVCEENRDWIARTWARIAADNDPAVIAFHNHEKNLIAWDMGNGSYLCKYLEKARQKDVPEGYLSVGRFWGSSRGVVPTPVWLNAEGMMAAFIDQADSPVIRAVRALSNYHKIITTYWKKDDNGLIYRARKSRVNSDNTMYSFSVNGGRKIFLEYVKFYERQQKGRETFKEWAIRQKKNK